MPARRRGLRARRSRATDAGSRGCGSASVARRRRLRQRSSRPDGPGPGVDAVGVCRRRRRRSRRSAATASTSSRPRARVAIRCANQPPQLDRRTVARTACVDDAARPLEPLELCRDDPLTLRGQAGSSPPARRHRRRRRTRQPVLHRTLELDERRRSARPRPSARRPRPGSKHRLRVGPAPREAASCGRTSWTRRRPAPRAWMSASGRSSASGWPRRARGGPQRRRRAISCRAATLSRRHCGRPRRVERLQGDAGDRSILAERLELAGGRDGREDARRAPAPRRSRSSASSTARGALCTPAGSASRASTPTKPHG